MPENSRRIEMYTPLQLEAEMRPSAPNRINPSPRVQRTASNERKQNLKTEGIIESILRGRGIGMFSMRDISIKSKDNPDGVYEANDPERGRYAISDAKLILDGGHRGRGMVDFINGEVYVTMRRASGKIVRIKYADLKNSDDPEYMEWYSNFVNCEIPVQIRVCTSEDAAKWFQDMNKQTPVTEIESIMANDASPTNTWIQERTWYYEELDNNEMIHPIFEIESTKKGKISKYWNKSNEGGRFFIYSWVTLLNAINRGNVRAGQKQWLATSISNYVPTKEDGAIFNRFFDFLMEYQDAGGMINSSGNRNKLEIKIFGVLSALWFHIYETSNGKFSIDMAKFRPVFNAAYCNLTAPNNSPVNTGYKDKTLPLGPYGEENELITNLIRDFDDAFSKVEGRVWMAEMFMEDMNTRAPNGDTGIIVQHARTIQPNIRKSMWVQQQERCWVDFIGGSCTSKKLGVTPTLADMEFAHDVGHAVGGTLEGGHLLCKHCHAEQGRVETLTEFMARKLQQAASERAKAA